jgi:hypothetical protein
MRGTLTAVLSSVLVFTIGACSGSEGGTNDGADPDTVSATEYATGVCGAIAGWVGDIKDLNAELQSNLEPTSIDSLKTAMVGFLDDVITATDSVIDEVENVGVPDVEDGEATAETVLTALSDSRDVFADARDRVDGLATDDPAAFGEELQTLATDLQTSLAGIGEELDRFDSPELDEASENVPECEQVSSAA